MATLFEDLVLRISGEDRTRPAFGSVRRGMADLSSAIARLAAPIAAAVGGFAFVRFLQDSVKAGIEADAVAKRLSATLETLGVSYQEVEGDLADYFSELQQTTRFGDEDTASALTTLVTLTGDFQASVKGLPAVLDLATAANMDLNAAGKLFSQALAGNISALTRYVPALKGVNGETFLALSGQERLNLILSNLGAITGAATREGQTLEVQLARLSNNYGDLQEAVGRAISEQSGLGTVVNRLAAAFKQLEALVVKGTFANLARTAKQIAAVVFESFAGAIRPIGEGFKNLADLAVTVFQSLTRSSSRAEAAFRLLATPIQGLIVVFGAVRAAFDLVIAALLRGIARASGAVGDLSGLLSKIPGLSDAIRDRLKLVSDVARDFSDEMARASATRLDGMIKGLEATARSSVAVGDAASKIPQEFENIRRELSKVGLHVPSLADIQARLENVAQAAPPASAGMNAVAQETESAAVAAERLSDAVKRLAETMTTLREPIAGRAMTDEDVARSLGLIPESRLIEMIESIRKARAGLTLVTTDPVAEQRFRERIESLNALLKEQIITQEEFNERADDARSQLLEQATTIETATLKGAKFAEAMEKLNRALAESGDVTPRVREEMERLTKSLTIEERLILNPPAIKANAQEAKEAVVKSVGEMQTTAQKVAESMRTSFEDSFFRVFQGETDALNNVWQNALGAMKATLDRELAQFASAILTSGVKSALRSVFRIDFGPQSAAGGAGFGDFLKGLGGAFTRLLPSFQTGGTVPGPVGAPRLAVVHGGERVVPVSGGAARPDRTIRIVNILDPNALFRAGLASNRDTLVNLVSFNALRGGAAERSFRVPGGVR